MVSLQTYVSSKYNHIFKVENDYLAINLLTNTVLFLDSEQYKLVRNFLEQQEPQDDYQRSPMYQLLVESKFLVPSDYNEIAYIERLFCRSKNVKRGFSLGLVITLQCNFRCPYCYQDHVDLQMRREVQLAVLNLLKRKLPGKESLKLGWWGGEPLLESQTIDTLGQEIIQICDSLGVQYSASITTNGYLLNEHNIRILAKGRITQVQVTLDGPKEFHDKRRFLANGTGTYDVILKNLYKLAQIPRMKITVRVNGSKGITKIDPWKQLFTDLAPVKKKIAISLEQVAPSKSFNKLCIANKKFHAFYNSVVEIIQKQGFHLTFGQRTPGAVFCGAIPINNWFVHPLGYISKCTVQADGLTGSLGRLLSNGDIKANSNAARWLNASPFKLKRCRECNVLPLCMGGCLKIPFASSIVDRCFIKKTLLSFVRNFLVKKKGGYERG